MRYPRSTVRLILWRIGLYAGPYDTAWKYCVELTTHNGRVWWPFWWRLCWLVGG